MYCPEKNVRKRGYSTIVMASGEKFPPFVASKSLLCMSGVPATAEDALDITLEATPEHKQCYTVKRNQGKDYYAKQIQQTQQTDDVIEFIGKIKAPVLQRVAVVESPGDCLKFLLPLKEEVDTLYIDMTNIKTHDEVETALLAIVRHVDKRLRATTVTIQVRKALYKDACHTVASIRPGCRLPDSRISKAFATSRLAATAALDTAYLDAARMLIAKFCGVTRTEGEHLYAWTALAQTRGTLPAIAEHITVHLEPFDTASLALTPGTNTWKNSTPGDILALQYIGNNTFHLHMTDSRVLEFIGNVPRLYNDGVPFRLSKCHGFADDVKMEVENSAPVPTKKLTWQLHDQNVHMDFYAATLANEISAIEEAARGSVYQLKWQNAAVLMPFIEQCIKLTRKHEPHQMCKYSAYSTFWGVDPAMIDEVPRDIPTVRMNTLMLRPNSHAIECLPAMYAVLKQLEAVELGCRAGNERRRWQYKVHTGLPLPCVLFESSILQALLKYRQNVFEDAQTYSEVMQAYDNAYVAAAAHRLEMQYQARRTDVPQLMAHTSCPFVIPLVDGAPLDDDTSMEPPGTIFNSFYGDDAPLFKCQRGVYTKVKEITKPTSLTACTLNVAVEKIYPDARAFEEHLAKVKATPPGLDFWMHDTFVTPVGWGVYCCLVAEEYYIYGKIADAETKVDSKYGIPHSAATATSIVPLKGIKDILEQGFALYQQTGNQEVFMKLGEKVKALEDGTTTTFETCTLTHILHNENGHRIALVVASTHLNDANLNFASWARHQAQSTDPGAEVFTNSVILALDKFFATKQKPETHGVAWIQFADTIGANYAADRFLTYGWEPQTLQLQDTELLFLGKDITMLLNGLQDKVHVIERHAPGWEFVLAHGQSIQANCYLSEDVTFDDNDDFSGAGVWIDTGNKQGYIMAAGKSISGLHTLTRKIRNFNNKTLDVTKIALRRILLENVDNAAMSHADRDVVSIAACIDPFKLGDDKHVKRCQARALKVLDANFFQLARTEPNQTEALARLSVYATLDAQLKWPTDEMEPKKYFMKWESRGLQVGFVANCVLRLVLVDALVTAVANDMMYATPRTIKQQWFPMSANRLAAAISSCDVMYVGTDVDAIDDAHYTNTCNTTFDEVKYCLHPMASGNVPPKATALTVAEPPLVVSPKPKRKPSKRNNIKL